VNLGGGHQKAPISLYYKGFGGSSGVHCETVETHQTTDPTTAMPTDTGLSVVEVDQDPVFLRRGWHPRDAVKQMEGMQRIAKAFVDSPETILQELVDTAVILCGADSAGISLEKDDRTDDSWYRWVATAGQYSGFMDAILPRFPSACGLCLARGTAQHFTVGQRFFDIMGISAPLVTDGVLLPWVVNETRGTIFIMAHGRDQAFDVSDARLMEVLANFAAMGVREQRQRKLLLEKTRIAAAAAMANDLAHKINNPLQSLTNILYLAEQGNDGEQARVVGEKASEDLKKLSSLVKSLLGLPFKPDQNPVE
jgi:hypothetical protein